MLNYVNCKFACIGLDNNEYCWISVRWFMDSGLTDEATQCKEFDFTDRSDLVDTLTPDYVRGHVHMVHKCRWSYNRMVSLAPYRYTWY